MYRSCSGWTNVLACLVPTPAFFRFLSQEFEAYRVHIGNLLQKERELNSKLRHLKS